MKKKLFFSLLIITLVTLPLLTACPTETTPTPTATPPPTVSPTAKPEAHWWDEFGEPQYGGTLTIRNAFLNGGSWDTTAGMRGGGGMATNVWLEGLTVPNWTEDPETWAYQAGWVPLEYYQGQLITGWEQPNPTTVTLHVREGVYWHDKPPVNGREFTAEDIQYNFDRALGTGSGFTEPHPFQASSFTAIERVVAIDKYTAEARLKSPSVSGLFQLFGSQFAFVPREWVEQADVADPNSIIGTGPWMPVSFIEGNKMEMTRNPNYWGVDERHPENKVPYADTLVQLAIPDPATALAALRTGKLDMWTDMMGALSWQQGETLARSDPEIQQAHLPRPAGTVMLRCDTKPFTDIRVRKALNMALDRKAIIENYYNNTIYGTTVGWQSSTLTGWTTPYDEWPQALKDEYSYNPEGARALLAEAGYPNGFKTNVVQRSDQDSQLLQLIKAYFMDIGVDMEIRVMDPPTYGAFIAAGKQDQSVYSDGMAGLLWGPMITFGNLTSQTIPQNNSTFNYDATFDAMYEQMTSAATVEEMQRLSRELDLYALQQHWAVTSVPSHTPVVWQPYVKGYTGIVLVNPTWAGHVRARLWIDQDLKREMGH